MSPRPRPLALTVSPARLRPSRRHGGLSRGGKTLSRAQQRLLFARYGEVARKWTTRGRYRRLPERKHPPGARSLR